MEKGEEKDTGGQGHGRSQQPGTSKCSHVHKMAGELAVARNSTNKAPLTSPFNEHLLCARHWGLVSIQDTFELLNSQVYTISRNCKYCRKRASS